MKKISASSVSMATILLSGLILLTSLQSCNRDKLPSDAVFIENFDSGNWNEWQSEGQAFGPAPYQAQDLQESMKDNGFKGGFANSNIEGVEAQGRLISPGFTIQKKYLNFLISGNAHFNAENCNVRLLIADSIVRYAAATRAPLIEWTCFDMEEYIGESAHIEIIDLSEQNYIMTDMIFQSNEMQLGPAKTSLTAEKKYLLLPVKKGEKQYRLRLEKEGDVTEQFVIEMGPGEPDFWAFKDISQYKGKKLTILSNSPVIPEDFDRIYQADTIPGQDGFYAEANRPQFHFTSKQGWINDPNGLVYHKGEWHLMYQHNPYGIIGSLKHWGHAISTDLVHWKERPSSVVPDDFGANHSGGAVVDYFNNSGLQEGNEETLIAYWTSAGHFTSPANRFRQCISFSNDKGRTWEKYSGNPIIGHIEGRNRDPNVIWHEQSKSWIMTLYLDQSDYAFLKSTDLINWELVDKITIPASECPDLFMLPLDGNENDMKWIFWGGNGNYVVGDFDGKDFTYEGEAQRTHFGNRYYASMTFNNAPEGRVIQLGWLTGRSPFMDEKTNFRCQLSIPNELTLKSNRQGVAVLHSNPVKELETLRGDEHLVENIDLIPGKTYVTDFEAELADLDVKINMGSAKEIIADIRGLKAIYNTEEKKLSFEDQEIQVETINNRINLRILVDRCSVEIFLNEGAKAVFISELIDPANLGYSFQATGGNAKIEKAEIYSLGSSWE